MFPTCKKDIVLASSSLSRRNMLEAAGVPVRVVHPNVDEAAIIEGLGENNLSPEDIAELLARTKAEEVSHRYGGSVVIGGDQVLALDGKIFSKPKNLTAAQETLFALRGTTHQLHSAVVVAENGAVGWVGVDTADLKMRDLSPEFIGKYLGTVGEDICRSVGAYEIEALGVHLFDEVIGDHFTIRGMPLIPLLKYLYDDGVLC